MGGINGTVKLQIAPLAKNQIQLRFENLADLYDRDANGTYFDLMGTLTALGKEANGNTTLRYSFGITEMSITGQLTYGDMVQRKIHWQTTEQDSEPEVYEPIDMKSTLPFYLGPERIRTFRVNYYVEDASNEVEIFM